MSLFKPGDRVRVERLSSIRPFNRITSFTRIEGEPEPEDCYTGTIVGYSPSAIVSDRTFYNIKPDNEFEVTTIDYYGVGEYRIHMVEPVKFVPDPATVDWVVAQVEEQVRQVDDAMVLELHNDKPEDLRLAETAYELRAIIRKLKGIS